MWEGGRVTKRCKRHDLPGHTHELTFSCYRSRPFLSVDRTCRWLAEAIDKARRQHDFSLWAYVFMPNHVHLVIHPRTKQYSISQVLKAIKTPVGYNATRYLKQNNPAGLERLATGQQYRKYRFWQKGGGYDRDIKCTDTLIQCVTYIHNNPIRQGLVEKAEDWLYSSAGQWAGETEGVLRIDKHDWPVHKW